MEVQLFAVCGGPRLNLCLRLLQLTQVEFLVGPGNGNILARELGRVIGLRNRLDEHALAIAMQQARFLLAHLRCLVREIPGKAVKRLPPCGKRKRIVGERAVKCRVVVEGFRKNAEILGRNAQVWQSRQAALDKLIDGVRLLGLHQVEDLLLVPVAASVEAGLGGGAAYGQQGKVS